MPSDYENVSSIDVEKFHKKADLDGSAKAAHHTLGANSTQASPGNHTHDGGSSLELLKGVTVTDLPSCIAALKLLGAS